MNDPVDPSADRAARERELLSALMDGEAGEHELHRALKATADDPRLAATWARWHVAQSVLRGDAVPARPVDLRAAISAALDAESAPAARPSLAERARDWLRPLAGVAVAATVAVVTVTAWQANRGETGAPLAAAASTADQRVALGSMVMVRADGEELVLPAGSGESPTAGQDRLNAYLARHAQAAGQGSARSLTPYARVVSFEGEQGR